MLHGINKMKSTINSINTISVLLKTDFRHKFIFSDLALSETIPYQANKTRLLHTNHLGKDLSICHLCWISARWSALTIISWLIFVSSIRVHGRFHNLAKQIIISSWTFHYRAKLVHESHKSQITKFAFGHIVLWSSWKKRKAWRKSDITRRKRM